MLQFAVGSLATLHVIFALCCTLVCILYSFRMGCGWNPVGSSSVCGVRLMLPNVRTLLINGAALTLLVDAFVYYIPVSKDQTGLGNGMI